MIRASTATNHYRLPEGTGIGSLHLRVADLQRSLSFYRDLLGLTETNRIDSTISLSASRTGESIISLTEKREAKPRPSHSTGLYHAAIVLPNRKELARVFARLYSQGWPFQGFADHGVSEALYLADAEGNGIELYADRPRDRWLRKDGQIQMVTLSLDLENLLAELTKGDDPWAGIHPETRIGHIHLQVSDLRKAERFYHELLGFDVTQRSFPGALFVSAGGYHHHIGLNVWDSLGGTAPSSDVLGLTKFSITIPGASERSVLRERLLEAGIPLEETETGVLIRDDDGIAIEVR
jgi:catechol 2,3-dioxygenase